MYNSIDSGNFVISVFLDFKKAFDTVDHKIWLSKFDFYRNRRVSHEWHKSYLSERNQITVIDGITKEDIGIEQQLYEIVRGKNFALNCLSWKLTETIMITNEVIPENLVVGH